jgi:FkbM family methyltransferase
VKTRNLGEIEFSVCCKDGVWRKMDDDAEFGFLVNLFWNIKSSVPFILKKSVERRDLVAPAIFALIAAKKFFGKEVNQERKMLFDRLGGISRVRVSFRGKQAEFSCSARTFGLIYQTMVMNQYDVGDEPLNGKTVVDVGANVGDFSIFCAFFNPKKVYAFEPMEHTFRLLEENISLNGLERLVVPVKKGLGAENFSISAKAGADAALGDGGDAGPGNEQLEIVRLDDFLDGEEIGFLKMDVEGYEENVLRGAEKSIARWKPVLSFSAYHRPTDKMRLPEIVKSIRSDYKIVLNRHFEEEFYCD